MTHASFHEGRPILSISKCRRYVFVKCPYGHAYHCMPMKEWAGSWLEAKASDPRWIVRCDGTITENTKAAE